MTTTTKKAIAFSLLGMFLCTSMAFANSGVNMDDVQVRLYAKQGGKWFQALTTNANNKGVVEAKNVIPGWYKIKIKSADEKSTQYVALRLKMRDKEGRKLYDKTPVKLYVKIDGKEIFIRTAETDKNGWLEVEHLSLDTEYGLEIEEKNGGSARQRDGQARIKVSAKIDGSNWFRALYGRTDDNMTLTAENVLPGKYKYRYDGRDRTPNLPFNLHIRLVNEEGEKIKEPTKIKLYAYIKKAKTPIGEVTTDAKGWVFLPNVMTEMTYAFEIIK